MGINICINQWIVRTFHSEIQVYIVFLRILIENLFRMNDRIHKRLPKGFVEEVFSTFNSHRISEAEAMGLLGIKRSRLYQLRKRWLLSNKKRPFSLWQRSENAFYNSDLFYTLDTGFVRMKERYNSGGH